MRALLLPSPTCLRHVRVDSGPCPFCDRGLPRSFGTSQAPFAPPRKTRAGMFSHTAAASLLAATACGGLVAGSNDDAGDATVPDATVPDAENGDTSPRPDVLSPPDLSMDAHDDGEDVADAPVEAP
jgi:hypothetical protein